MTTRRTFLATLAAAGATYALSGVAALAVADDAVDFFRAVEMDDARSVKSLLGRGVDPNGTSRAGEPALVLAVREGSMQVLDVLLAAPGIRVDAPAMNGNTALMMAAFKGNRPAVDALLAKGAAVNREGWTPLHYAAAAGDVGIAGLLLQRGARIDAVSPKASGAYTPLMMAAREGREECAVFLAGKGADRRRKNAEGLDAARIAERADHRSIAAALR
ncbi:ankyrin repeat domain-containing protein [uncultured Massilia sp.]|uniref:ankyrin repeat domain-containing protein n=1 Tax=uncultured Massilia sp. TaxID=169973 RepID=UPI0025F08196|nr:ankyrin repeat domain-containing protein [uncultured Massilia sp.]